MVTFNFHFLQNGTLTVKGNQTDWSLHLNKCLEVTEHLRILGRKWEGSKEERERKDGEKKRKEKEFSISLEPLLLCCFYEYKFYSTFPNATFYPHLIPPNPLLIDHSL